MRGQGNRVPGRSIAMLLGAGVLGTGLLCTGLLTGCAGPAGNAAPGSASAEGPASGTGGEGGGTGGEELRDLSEGGTCEDGESVTIKTDGASPVIEGGCATVTITANGVGGNIDSAAIVAIAGDDNVLLGSAWGTAVINGDGAGLNVEEIGELAITGAGAKVTNHRLRTATVDGDGAIVNTEGIEQLTVNGDRSVFVVSGPISEFEVRGDDNTFNWDEGLEAPSADTGSGNVYVR